MAQYMGSQRVLYLYLVVVAHSLSHSQLFPDPMHCSTLGSVCVISRQEYCSGLSFLSRGDLPHPEIKASLLHWQTGSLPLSHQGSL